jgi:hypothetical protein
MADTVSATFSCLIQNNIQGSFRPEDLLHERAAPATVGREILRQPPQGHGNRFVPDTSCNEAAR